MKLEYTPGPWRVMDAGPLSEGRRIFAANHYIGFIGNSDDQDAQHEVNARLISASPELLDVAREGYELSRYAACSKIENTEEFLTGLMERIELYQYNCKRVIESATGKKIEEVL